jgi:hypothetical protein
MKEHELKRIALILMAMSVFASGISFADNDGVVDKAGHGIKKGGETAERGIEKGATATEKGLKKGGEATEKGLKKAGKWVGNGLSKAGDKIERVFK